MRLLLPPYERSDGDSANGGNMTHNQQAYGFNRQMEAALPAGSVPELCLKNLLNILGTIPETTADLGRPWD